MPTLEAYQRIKTDLFISIFIWNENHYKLIIEMIKNSDSGDITRETI